MFPYTKDRNTYKINFPYSEEDATCQLNETILSCSPVIMGNPTVAFQKVAKPIWKVIFDRYKAFHLNWQRPITNTNSTRQNFLSILGLCFTSEGGKECGYPEEGQSTIWIVEHPNPPASSAISTALSKSQRYLSMYLKYRQMMVLMMVEMCLRKVLMMALMYPLVLTYLYFPFLRYQYFQMLVQNSCVC